MCIYLLGASGSSFSCCLSKVTDACVCNHAGHKLPIYFVPLVICSKELPEVNKTAGLYLRGLVCPLI